MEFAAVPALVALIYATTNFLKYVTNRQWNAVVTQLEVWVAGVSGLFLASRTDFAPTIEVGAPLSTLNGWSLLFIGLSVSSIATGVYDFKKALDSSDSAATPKLLTK